MHVIDHFRPNMTARQLRAGLEEWIKDHPDRVDEPILILPMKPSPRMAYTFPVVDGELVGRFAVYFDHE